MFFIFSLSQDWQSIFKTVVIGFVVFCVLFTVSEPVAAQAPAVVSIPDDGLRQAVRDALNLAADDVLETDKMRRLKVLKATELSISKLTGLEHAPNLEELDLSFNGISNFSPVASLNKLKKLNLSINGITDISPLTDLTELEELYLNLNLVNNLTPLAGLTKLTLLDLSINTINDITPLAGLTKLKHLRLGSLEDRNQISNISPLAGLTSLTMLDLNQNNISVLTPLQSLTELQTLDLSNNQISDVGALSGLTSLLFLYLDGNTITNYQPLHTLRAANPDVWIDILPTDTTAGAPRQATSPHTALLSNYPNPFNPETWIPYQLAKAADVTVTIYDMRGVMVREFVLGYQPAGVYRSRARAVHWDGHNDFGEKVASGVYFYTLTAGEFTATRKLLIRK